MNANGEDGRSPSVFMWADSAGLNSFDVRQVHDDNLLLTAGHGPHEVRRYTSIVLDPDAVWTLYWALNDLLLAAPAAEPRDIEAPSESASDASVSQGRSLPRDADVGGGLEGW